MKRHTKKAPKEPGKPPLLSKVLVNTANKQLVTKDTFLIFILLIFFLTISVDFLNLYLLVKGLSYKV